MIGSEVGKNLIQNCLNAPGGEKLLSIGGIPLMAAVFSNPLPVGNLFPIALFLNSEDNQCRSNGVCTYMRGVLEAATVVP